MTDYSFVRILLKQQKEALKLAVRKQREINEEIDRMILEYDKL